MIQPTYVGVVILALMAWVLVNVFNDLNGPRRR